MHSNMWFTILLYYNSVLIVISAATVKEQPEFIPIPASQQKIHEITNKIDKIAYNLLTHSSSNNRSSILSNLENKLLKASDHLGQRGKKHVKFIIDGIKLKVLNETEYKQMRAGENVKRAVDNNNDHINKSLFIDELANKIELLIDNELQKLKTSELKKKLLHVIKTKILESFNKKQVEILKNINYINGSRRMGERKHESNAMNSLNNESNIHGIESEVKLNQNVSHNIEIYNTSNKYKSLAISSSCYKFYSRICDDIKNINRLKCRYGLGYITLDKLCNGIFDCPSKSDENHCDLQVMEKVHYAEQVMADMDIHQQTCFDLDISKSVLPKQSQILRDVLKRRLALREKYKKVDLSVHARNIAGKRIINHKVNEKREVNGIAIIISSLALTLDGTLCSNKLDFDTRRNTGIFEMDLDKEFKDSLSSPKSCKCKKEFCYNCTYYCKRLCRQKYSLVNWNCESINRTNTVSLNLLCDGKLDCFDESDERGCITGSGYSKFEAHETYNNILKMLQLKASKQRQPVQKNLLYLSSLIMGLQNLTMKSVPKYEIIKKLRDKCYSMLRKIYLDMITQSYIDSESEEAYLFLLSINHNLGKALKLSRTGNTKLIENICHCRKGTCSKSVCSKVCVRACIVEPKLTKYYCKGYSNKSVKIDQICDGMQDCADGYDERYCKKDEICRRHHLVVLQHNLQNVGEHFKGTALGELLSTWKLKVISNLKVAQRNERPSPQVFKKVIQELLRDLVVTYGYVENYRRKNKDYALEVFLNISQIILESIKTCNK